MKKELINYLENTGKNKSWNEIAFMFGYTSGEQARKVWCKHCKKETKLSSFTHKTKEDVISDFGCITKASLAWNNAVQFTNTNNVLVIGDLHIPAELPNALEFVKTIYTKYKCSKVIFTGDILDSYCLSMHIKNPNYEYTSGQELEVAKTRLKAWYKAFPNAVWITGNHDNRLYKLAGLANIPKQYLKSLQEILEVPNWEVVSQYVHNNILYVHGESKEAKLMAVYKGMSVVQGHLHSKTYIDYVKKDVFGMQVPSLVDRNKMEFEYAKNSIMDWQNGVAVIEDGIPIIIPYK
jgi:metallophosphoesterase superfamily enzyme